MFKVGFYLANKNEKSSIDAVIRFSGIRYKYPAGVSVKAKHWNSKSQRAHEVKAYTDSFVINARLETIEKAVRQTAEGFFVSARIPTNKEFCTAVDRLLNPEKNIAPDRELSKFIESYSKTLTRAKNTLKRYGTTLTMLREFEKDNKVVVTFDNLNMTQYNQMLRYFAKKDYSINTYGDYIKNLKVFFRAARNAGLHSSFLPDEFTNTTADSDSIYLSENELQKISNLVIDEKLILEHYDTVILNVTGNVNRAIVSLQDCSDRFMIGAYTAMRFGDYSALEGLISTDAFISRISEKTGTKTVIPMHPVIREILIRRNNILPGPVSNQKMNKQLKVLGRMAGITEPVEITIMKLSGKERKMVPKYELISTHTARRSGCTNMALAGIEIMDIMSFSGHGTMKSFKKYIRASSQQVANKVKDHPFFQIKKVAAVATTLDEHI